MGMVSIHTHIYLVYIHTGDIYRPDLYTHMYGSGFVTGLPAESSLSDQSPTPPTSL